MRTTTKDMGDEKKPTKEEGQKKNNGDEEIYDAPVEAASANANDDDDDMEIEEIEREEEVVVRSDKTFHERILLIMEKFASYELGQEVIKRTDRMLKVFEDTARWSLPASPEVRLVRPLPWIPFLALLLLMRMARFWCSVVSFVTRLHPVRPQEVVYFFQTRRRTLRVVRINGLKIIRNRDQQPPMKCRYQRVRNVDEGFLLRLRGFLSGSACRPSPAPGVPRPHPFAPLGKMINLADLQAELKAQAELELQPQPSTSQSKTDGSRKRARKSKKRRDDSRNLTVDEMLDKYGNLNTDNTDSDYNPSETHRSIPSNCSSNAEETERENVQAPAVATVHNENAENVENSVSVENMENNDNEFKESGNSKSMDANDRKSETEAESNRDQEGDSNENDSSDTVKHNSDSGESNAATSEVASTSHASTPITNKSTHLAVASLQEEENKQKSTPGHETAASLKPLAVTSSATESQKSKNKSKVEEKCYRTITTQTCLEIDWSITIKTEITHRRTRPEMENLNYSVQLTPATSDEDIFYSPLGSPQDFHTIFQPAPIVKGSTTEAQLLTPERTEQLESSNSEATPDSSNSAGPKQNNHNHNRNQNQKQKPRKRRNRR